MSEYPTLAIVKALAAHLKSAVPSLVRVHEEWPAPGQVLQMPCASVLTFNQQFIQGHPIKLSQGSAVNHRADVLYHVGQWETQLQIDIWTASKGDRAKYLELVMLALSPTFADGANGVNLTLSDYHSQVASYLAVKPEMDMSEASAQRREWRATIAVDVFCNAVRESRQYVMESIEVTMEPSTDEVLS